MELFRVVIGFSDQTLSATWPFIELLATEERLEFRAPWGLAGFWDHGALNGPRSPRSSGLRVC